VASRILPVKVHDLDAEDKALIENEIGGVLRAIEFIYREPGVNRPLKVSDKKEDNHNHTDYANQLNKVANAIKEIITAIKNPSHTSHVTNATGNRQPIAGNKPNATKKLLIASVILLCIALGYIAYQNFSSHNQRIADTESSADKSIAVLPFVNMSTDKDQEYFSDGLSEELLNLLAKIPDLKVIARTSSFSFKGKNEDLRTIGEKLGVAHILEGSVRKDGDQMRITAQLIRVADGTHLWSETYDRKLEGIFKVQDEISAAVVNQLKLKLLNTAIQPAPMKAEAYNLYLEGKFFTGIGNKESYEKAIEKYNAALAIDPDAALVWAGLSSVYSGQIGNGIIPVDDGFRQARQVGPKKLCS
jgi:TolB-like protein